MQHRTPYLMILIVLCIAMVCAGCSAPATPPATTPAATAAAATQSPQAPAQDNLVVSPTDAMPDNNYVSVIVQEKDYLGNIPVVFDGGKGLILVKSASVTLYRSDGQVMTTPLGIKKGDTVNLQGTKQTDRVVVYVSEVNGVTYRVADVLSEYRTRQ